MLDSIEHYKSQQLERLRENYAQQVSETFFFDKIKKLEKNSLCKKIPCFTSQVFDLMVKF